MGAAKPSKKQRGKKNAAAKAKKAGATGGSSKSHVKFDDDGEQVRKAPQKKRARAAPASAAKEGDAAAKEGGGRSDRSPEAIQQARYYLDQWRRRAEPTPEGELPWKFKVSALVECSVSLYVYGLLYTQRAAFSLCVEQKMKQMWILQWMYEADVVPKSMFAIVLDYLNGIEGQAREVRSSDAVHMPAAGPDATVCVSVSCSAWWRRRTRSLTPVCPRRPA